MVQTKEKFDRKCYFVEEENMGKIIITDDNGEDREYLHQRVQKYNQKYFEKAEFQDISVCLKSESGEIQAGLAGTVRGNWFLVWNCG